MGIIPCWWVYHLIRHFYVTEIYKNFYNLQNIEISRLMTQKG